MTGLIRSDAEVKEAMSKVTHEDMENLIAAQLKRLPLGGGRATSDARPPSQQLFGPLARGRPGWQERPAPQLLEQAVISLAIDPCACGCAAAMHIGEIGCPCGLPDEPPCATGDSGA